MSSCFCIGPQNGQPLCPCKMKDVKIVKGRYVRTEDLGPAPSNHMDTMIWHLGKPRKLEFVDDD